MADRTELDEVVVELAVAGGGDDGGAGRLPELDRASADPAGGAGDEQALPRSEAGLGKQRIEGGRGGLHEGAGGLEVDVFGDLESRRSRR